MAGIIPDPDFDGFDGRFVDDKAPRPEKLYNYTEMCRYMRENNKSFQQMSPEEIEQFRTN